MPEEVPEEGLEPPTMDTEVDTPVRPRATVDASRIAVVDRR
jgi:hypothetical protein